MKKRIKIFFLLNISILMVGCSPKVGELYQYNAYNHGGLKDDYYFHWDKTLKDSKNNITIYSNDDEGDYKPVNADHELGNRIDNPDLPIRASNETCGNYTYDNNASLNKEEGKEYLGLERPDFTYTSKKDGEQAVYAWDVEKDNENGFGTNKCLFKIDKSFGSTGVVSKLYDGRVYCQGKYEKSRVQIDEDGFSTFFPKSLESVKYFGLSFRGATTCTKSLRKDDVEVKIILSFYKHNSKENNYSEYKYVMNTKIHVDNDSNVTFLTYYFTEAQKKELKYASGYSVRFELTDERYKSSYITKKDPNLWLERDQEGFKEHFVLMLYEFFLPDSTWQ